MSSRNKLINPEDVRSHVEVKPETEDGHLFAIVVEVFLAQNDEHGNKISETSIGHCKATYFDRPETFGDEDGCKNTILRLDADRPLRDFLKEFYDDSGRFVKLEYMPAAPDRDSMPGAYLVDASAAILCIDSLFVDPGNRRNGMGAQMLGLACVEVKKRMRASQRWFAVGCTDTVSGEAETRGGREATRLARQGVETFLKEVGFLEISTSKWWAWDLPATAARE
ncbi:hypothetical protein K490DRAFT_67615 [Saccharata proteae CBS 121410]|uniref:N-acetyltransferase domain-containing protein n=1 Tax=Saccharata proteae CBS 121410 TaxID=1314787 RepID=A0A9P4LTD8_9PEZI|nr:hypothetical protein K490DRAFT_67615 [Saccharata proteae CBS 121410]